MKSSWKDECQEPFCCISHEFLRSALKNPSKVAVVHASGGLQICREMEKIALKGENLSILEQEWPVKSPPVFKGDVFFTYGELLSAVEALSCQIRKVFVGKDDLQLSRTEGYDHSVEDPEVPVSESVVGLWRQPRVVGVHMTPSVEYIVAILSVLRCGGAFLPLDPSWPQDRLLQVATCSQCSLVLTCSTSSRSIWAQIKEFSVLYFSMISALPNNGLSNLEWPCKSKFPRLYCYLMYTSGSSGKPKGVCGTEEGLVNRFLWMQKAFPVCHGETLLFKTPVSFIDHIQEILTAVLSCTPLIIPPDELRAYPFYLVDILKLYRISRLVTVPSLARALLPVSLRSKWIELRESLKLLVLSGQTLFVSLWSVLYQLLPETVILNLYGSTEISGDCTFFDCTNLPKILQTEALTTVPIGIPMPNCDVNLQESDTTNEGEICVSGSCVFAGYFDDICKENSARHSHPPFFKTGDFARRLHSGDLLFIGRRDRTVKVNGQRIALEEVEDALLRQPDVINAAVIEESHGDLDDSCGLNYLKAYIVLNIDADSHRKQTSSINENVLTESLVASIKSWLSRRLPPGMLPADYSFVKSLPVSSSGKVDYVALQGLCSLSKHLDEEKNQTHLFHERLGTVKQVFCDVLVLEKVQDNDDFFALGGNSILAALFSHRLGVDMRLIYSFPTPASLAAAALDREVTFQSKRLKLNNSSVEKGADHKILMANARDVSIEDSIVWSSGLNLSESCSFSRCNQFTWAGNSEEWKCIRRIETKIDKLWDFRELWRVQLKSCVDASPLLVSKNQELLVFIGSHSCTFCCLDALSGSVRWKTPLAGRIECSAAVTSDFSHVVVGCYEGNIYFLDFDSGAISWIFRTSGEVKMQPVAWRNLVWCGSHDHWVYALDYVQQSCVYKVFCGGSPYGSPAVDMAKNLIYLASTSGRVTAVLAEPPTFKVLWVYESGAPVFGSPSLDSSTGNVICCGVDGRVVSLNSAGSVVWQAITGGPIFAGACISRALPCQVLVCSRDGGVYSFQSWRAFVGAPAGRSDHLLSLC
ncbi:AMP-dependent synthetase and ligase family protein isoform X2 [Wolffia australiana]